MSIPEIISGESIKEKNRLTFVLTNVSDKPLDFPNLKLFVLEKKVNENWERIPIYPCACGVPCAYPPVPTRLNPKESIEVDWDYISRKCRGGESTEYSIGNGEYKVSFDYKVIENDKVGDIGTWFLNFTMN